MSLVATGEGPGEPRKGAELWAKARAVKTTVKLTRRWHKDVDTWYKRLWLTFQGSHTLLAGLLYRGTVGFSRAQTVMMILSNSAALPLPIALPLPLALTLTPGATQLGMALRPGATLSVRVRVRVRVRARARARVRVTLKTALP